MIRFVCECGKQLQAHEESAGKLVVCPACQRQLTVPAELLPSEAVQAERPSHRDEPELEENRECDDRPRRQPAGSSRKAIVSLILGILSLFCNVLVGVPAVILAILALRDISRSRGRLSGQGLAIAGIITACVCTLLSCGLVPAILLPAVQKVQEAAARTESMNNLRHIALAMLNYHDANLGRLPAAAICDKNGKPLLSWRVAILPYIEQQHLYKQFKLDEPWDSPNNKRLLAQMPRIYKLPGDDKTPPDYTHYQVFVGNGAAFEKREPTRIPADFRDGTSNTILIVEASQPVPWSEPEDIAFDPDKPIKPLLGSHHRGGCLAAMADGLIRWVLLPHVSESTLKAAITRNAGDALGPDW
jgi:hypothetical protein